MDIFNRTVTNFHPRVFESQMYSFQPENKDSEKHEKTFQYNTNKFNKQDFPRPSLNPVDDHVDRRIKDNNVYDNPLNLSSNIMMHTREKKPETDFQFTRLGMNKLGNINPTMTIPRGGYNSSLQAKDWCNGN